MSRLEDENTHKFVVKSRMIMKRIFSYLTHFLVIRRCSSFTSRNERNTKIRQGMDGTALNVMAPIGPFCPFRSEAALAIDPRLESLNAATPELSTEMGRLQLYFQIGQTPEPNRLRKVVKGIDTAVDVWESLLARLNLSSDFQTREDAKLTQAHLSKHGQSSDEVASMMRWQSQCMIAIAGNIPPTLPPSGIDVMKMMQQAQNNQQDQGNTSQPLPWYP